MRSASENSHRDNNDLLIDAGDLYRAQRAFPSLNHVLQHPPLQDAFRHFDELANDAKKGGRNWGLTAIALGTVSLIIAAATPEAWALGLVAAICGVVSIAVGLGGAHYAGAKWRWLCEHVATAMRLSLRERMGQPLTVMGTAYFCKRQFDEAAATLLLFIQDHPGFSGSYRILAACYAHMERLDEARAIVAQLRAITSLVVPDDLPMRNPEDRDLLLSGLRLVAGETS